MKKRDVVVAKVLVFKIRNKSIGILGVTFNANTEEMRDSSSVEMITYISKKEDKIKKDDQTGIKKE